MSNVLAVGNHNFEVEVLKATEPVVVDFWAEWCGPCRALGPTLDRVAQKYEGKLKVVKVNVDENRQLALKYGVQGIPNLLFFKNGQLVNQAVGNMNEASLSSKVEEVIRA